MHALPPVPSLSLPQFGKPLRRRDAEHAEHVTAPARGPLVDQFGRMVRDLRLSITDRCNFRCTYCLAPDARFLPSDERLTTAELIRVGKLFARLGVERLRVTGGEPSTHPDLVEILSELSPLFQDVSMTTNGSLLDERTARQWRGAGLRRVTISIDSLDEERFRAISRTNSNPTRVLAGVRAAIAAGLGPVNVNSVLLAGVNDSDAPALAELARELALEVRFIEFMPLDAERMWSDDCVVPSDRTIQRISKHFPLVLEGRDRPDRTALRYRFADGAAGSVSTIAPVSEPFCGECSRVRVTADGFVRPCLLTNAEWPLRALLRAHASDEAVEAMIRQAVWNKDAGGAYRMQPHDEALSVAQRARTMSAIGG